MIRAVVFDFYGVVCADAYTAWQHRYVPDWKEREVQFADISRRSDSGQLALQDFYTELADIAGSDWKSVRDQLGESMQTDAAVLAIIDELHAKDIKVGLLSNSPVSLYNTLDDFGIRDKFDAILTSEEAGVLKPERAIFEQILKKLSMVASETVFIDDRQVHVDGAVAAGLHGVLFTGAYQLETDLADLGIQL